MIKNGVLSREVLRGHLLSDRFFVDGRKKVFYEFGRQASGLGTRATFVNEACVSGRLNDGKAFCPLEFAYTAGHSHAAAEEVEYVGVDSVDFIPKEFQRSFGGSFGGSAQGADGVEEGLRRQLLCGIRQRLVGATMDFDDKAVEAHVESLSAKRGNQVPPASRMARVEN